MTPEQALQHEWIQEAKLYYQSKTKESQSNRHVSHHHKRREPGGTTKGHKDRKPSADKTNNSTTTEGNDVRYHSVCVYRGWHQIPSNLPSWNVPQPPWYLTSDGHASCEVIPSSTLIPFYVIVLYTVCPITLNCTYPCNILYHILSHNVIVSHTVIHFLHHHNIPYHIYEVAWYHTVPYHHTVPSHHPVRPRVRQSWCLVRVTKVIDPILRKGCPLLKNLLVQRDAIANRGYHSPILLSHIPFFCTKILHFLYLFAKGLKCKLWISFSCFTFIYSTFQYQNIALKTNHCFDHGPLPSSLV